MKILHVIESTATGVLSMASALANDQARHHAVRLVYSRREETPQNIEKYFAPDVVLQPLQMLRPLEWLKALFFLRRQVRSDRPDVVFLHSSVAGFLGRVALLSCVSNTKIIYIPHCISFLRKDVGALKLAAFILLERIAALRKAVYVACSESERAVIKRHFPGASCELIENAIVIDDALLPAVGREPGKAKIVVSVGQIRRQKNPEEFAAIARAMSAVDPALKFVWVGDGDEQLKASLLDAGVQIRGWLPKQEVLSELSRADVYLSCSLWEGLPVSVLEALYMGVPVLVSDCEGNADIVRHGLTGYVYRSPQEAVMYLHELLNDTQLAQGFIGSALEDFKQRFSFESYSVKMNALLL